MSERITIGEYYHENGSWYQISKYFANDLYVEENSVPKEVKNEFLKISQIQEEAVAKKVGGGKPIEKMQKAKQFLPQMQHPKKKKKIAQLPTKASAYFSDTNLRQRGMTIPAKFDPRKSSSVNKVVRLEEAEVITDEEGTIVVTDSQQIIRPLRAQLKATQPKIATELFQRLEIRKKIMDRAQNLSGAKPFEPPRKKWATDPFFKEREENRKTVHGQMMKMVNNLEQVKHQQNILERTMIGQDEYSPMAKRMALKSGFSFKISELSSFAKARGLCVLNLDQFICATDDRQPIYNSNGHCIFCEIHGVQTGGRHPTKNDCPFISCVCVQCYVAEKLSEAESPAGSSMDQ